MKLRTESRLKKFNKPSEVIGNKEEVPFFNPEKDIPFELIEKIKEIFEKPNEQWDLGHTRFLANVLLTFPFLKKNLVLDKNLLESAKESAEDVVDIYLGLDDPEPPFKRDNEILKFSDLLLGVAIYDPTHPPEYLERLKRFFIEIVDMLLYNQIDDPAVELVFLLTLYYPDLKPPLNKLLDDELPGLLSNRGQFGKSDWVRQRIRAFLILLDPTRRLQCGLSKGELIRLRSKMFEKIPTVLAEPTTSKLSDLVSDILVLNVMSAEHAELVSQIGIEYKFSTPKARGEDELPQRTTI